MPHNAHTEFDQHVLDMIDASPVGGVPRTPAHQAALAHLIAAHQVYVSADHADGYVTVRSLATQPLFAAENLADIVTGALDRSTLESDNTIYDRYVASLPESLQPAAEAYRQHVVGRRRLHRTRADGVEIHDPLHSLFLVPGGGLNPGLPGNYLFGALVEDEVDNPQSTWSLHLHDRLDGAASREGLTREAALASLDDLLASAPFLLSELEVLDYRLN